MAVVDNSASTSAILALFATLALADNSSSIAYTSVLVAAKRAHQLSSGGHRSTLDVGKDKPSVVALREIEAGLINASISTEVYARPMSTRT
jgi:DNA-directed RNA polymerase omega subunit